MTNIEALEKSIEMWKWLRDQAIQGKFYKKKDWFYKNKKPTVINDCYLCQFVQDISVNEITCKNCPIKSWKVDGSEDDYPEPDCCQYKSPYVKWLKGISLVELLQEEDILKGSEIINNVIEGSAEMVELLEKNLKKF